LADESGGIIPAANGNYHGKRRSGDGAVSMQPAADADGFQMGGDSRFTIQAGVPHIGMTSYHALRCAGRWCAKPNLTVSFGLR
jgi:hypothetical protein